ncbi:MAG: hypothetical protein JO356_21225 [Acidobacteria bacterium]|nr:hypothetical protein [Acidobacteriota bacterium]
MNQALGRAVHRWCALAVAIVLVGPATAQMSDVKEKPPMYSYVSNWSLPRAQWSEMEKSAAADDKILEKALGNGTIVGYGHDVNLVHRPDGETHDDWWSATSMGGILNVLEQFYKSGTTTTPVLASATKHWDSIYVSRYYNWHSGPIKDGYTFVGFYKLKPHASDDALDTLSKNLVAPVLEKLLSEGTILEYEIDTQAIHSEDPGSFVIVYVAAAGEGIDKVNAAIRGTLKASPLDEPAFDSMVERSGHRDELVRTNAVYK